MNKIVVFDSGFGSLSIIRPIQKITKSQIIYFADQKNFPYGQKSKTQLRIIIRNRLSMLNGKFNPDLIVLGSNTPTLLLNDITNNKVIGVLPPLAKAVNISKTKNIAILATRSVVQSKELSNYIKNMITPKKLRIIKINASPLVNLVESGDFLDNPTKCVRTIKKILRNVIYENNIDVATLSSTHLPFLQRFLKNEFPQVKFLDPGNEIAQIIKKHTNKKIKRNKLSIYTSSNPERFHKQLQKIGIDNKVNFLS